MTAITTATSGNVRTVKAAESTQRQHKDATMPDTITVTFGGREVVLAHELGRLYASRHILLYESDPELWMCRWIGHDIRGHGSTPQAAVDAVESKLRELVRQINEVLG